MPSMPNTVSHSRAHAKNKKQHTSSSLAFALRMDTKNSLLASWYRSRMSVTDKLPRADGALGGAATGAVDGAEFEDEEEEEGCRGC